MENLKGKFIISYRPRYFGESKEHYNLTDNKIRMFVVLAETENHVMATCINFQSKGFSLWDTLKAEDYKCLKYDSYSNGEFYLVKKEDIISVLSDELLIDDYHKIFNYIKFLDISTYDIELRNLIKKVLSEYYKDRIKIGSVVSIKVSNELFRIFYVMNLYNDFFEGIELGYEPTAGLFIKTLEEKFISYGSVYDTIFYTEEMNKKVNMMIEEAKLTLK